MTSQKLGCYKETELGESLSVGRKWSGFKGWSIGDKKESLGLYSEQGNLVRGVVLVYFIFT